MTTGLVGKELGIGEFVLLDMCRSRGIDTWTCSDKRDLVNIILSKPIVTVAAADTDAVGTYLQMLPFNHSRRVGDGPKRLNPQP